MKTTLVLDDGLVEQVRQRARARGVSMSSIVEEAIFKLLLEQPSVERPESHPLPRYRLGDFLVDVADRDALHDAMDDL